MDNKKLYSLKAVQFSSPQENVSNRTQRLFDLANLQDRFVVRSPIFEMTQNLQNVYDLTNAISGIYALQNSINICKSEQISKALSSMQVLANTATICNKPLNDTLASIRTLQNSINICKSEQISKPKASKR